MRILPKILAICLFCLLQMVAWGQDVITTTKGSKIEAAVLDTKGDFVTYKNVSTQKVYQISKNKVAQVRFADGRTESYSVAATAATPKSTAPAAPKKAAKSMDKGFFVGISAGGGVATGRYDYKTSAAPPPLSVRFAPTAGINLDWRAARFFALQMNVMYKGKGDRINMDRWAQRIVENETIVYDEPVTIIHGKGYRSTNIHAVEVSLLPVFVIARQFEFGVGAYLGYGLAGKQKSDYTFSYDFSEFPIDDETYKSELPIEFVSLVPESIDEGKLYLNRFDRGVIGHLGLRFNPLKISFDLSVGLRQWEPDSKLAGLFFNNLDHTYNIAGTCTVGWFF
jgi:hypothetical protein